VTMAYFEASDARKAYNWGSPVLELVATYISVLLAVSRLVALWVVAQQRHHPSYSGSGL